MNHPKLTPERLLRTRHRLCSAIHPQPSDSITRKASVASMGWRIGPANWAFQTSLVIDEDLGRTGSGLVDRPGFQRLVAEVCTGEVGAVFCIEASRLARNGRDWHHLIELCGMVGAVVVDLDGVYDPNLINDRLLLGLKGTMSEFEATLIRQRSIEAIHQKARRGELWIPIPVGFCWTSNGKIEKDPDQRVQQTIQLVFDKMTELGSMRQVLIWFRQQNVCLPVCLPQAGEPSDHLEAAAVSDHSGHPHQPRLCRRLRLRQNRDANQDRGWPRTEDVPATANRDREWMVLIQDHHPGYLSWEEYERNQAMIAANTHMQSGAEPKAGRGGRALLSGLLRCRRCGRMLYVSYIGPRATVIRYDCRGTALDCGEGPCISFGGLRVDDGVGNEVLHAIEGNAIEAALQAAEQMQGQQRQDYEDPSSWRSSRLATKLGWQPGRYDAVDPEQRLVAAELEARWNVALQKVQGLENKLREFDDKTQSARIPDRQVLMSLAQDLPAIWNSPSTDMRLKQRIIRILIREIVADVDDNNREIVLLIHWAGGRHSELRLKKIETGKHRHCTNVDAIEVIRKMAGRFPDEQIAATLNRLRLRTGADNAWNESRVYSVRHRHQLPTFDPNQRNLS